MRKLKFVALILLLTVFNCESQNPTKFSEEALNDTFVSLDDESLSFKEILANYEGKTILIDVWASWCKDCIAGMPKMKELQESKQEIVYVFLSLDKSIDSWKKGIEKYKVEGEHYFMKSGWDGPFGTFLDLDWIPRYLVVDEAQNIKIFKEIKVNKNLKNSLP